jgi:hypothetical protein
MRMGRRMGMRIWMIFDVEMTTDGNGLVWRCWLGKGCFGYPCMTCTYSVVFLDP